MSENMNISKEVNDILLSYNDEDIVDIKYYTENEWLYCTIIWEDK